MLRSVSRASCRFKLVRKTWTVPFNYLMTIVLTNNTCACLYNAVPVDAAMIKKGFQQ